MTRGAFNPSGFDPAGVSLCVLSWRAPLTLRATLHSYAEAGILELFSNRLAYFNEISAEDRAVASEFGLEALGTAENVGIFGGNLGLATRANGRYLLMLENDCPLVTDRAGLLSTLTSALGDMDEAGCKVFSLRSRYEPGDKFERRARYEARFRVHWPIGAATPRAALSHPLRRWVEDTRRPSARGGALFAEQYPERRHPRIIKRTARGNFLTTSRVLNWSNNAILVEAAFYRDVILERVKTHPSPTLLNGHQDIEAALKLGNWWRRQNIVMGWSEPGAFTHKRLDR